MKQVVTKNNIWGNFLKSIYRAEKNALLIVFLAGLTGHLLLPKEQPSRESLLPRIEVALAPAAMLKQINQVLRYVRVYREKDRRAVHPGLFFSCRVTLEDVESTLLFCKDILSEDMKKGKTSRLQDPVFLNTNFRALRWFPKPADPANKNRIRITKYTVFTISGREKKDDVFRYALYEIPGDEKGLSQQEALLHRSRLSRFKYTKQMVLAGAYDMGGAKPLIWLRKQDLEKALMQGTICVKDENKRKRYFNVSRNNGIPYDPGTSNPQDQKRYWYFFEVSEPKGYGMDTESMITIYPDAALAGDVFNLGLGKLMAIKDKKIRLGILADTGGAFSPGLNHLDYFTGEFDSSKEFREKAKTIPEFAEVYILVKRTEVK